jgi:vacuolar-type H+-ATPase subunit F/Vma7
MMPRQRGLAPSTVRQIAVLSRQARNLHHVTQLARWRVAAGCSIVRRQVSIFVVGEAPTVEAFESIGVPCRILEPGADVAAVVNELARTSKVQLVLVQSVFAAQLAEGQLDQLGRKFGCLVLEIPGIGQAAPDARTFRQSVQRSIGVLT